MQTKVLKVVAPVRADLAGGTADMWPLYCMIGGAKTINVALDLWVCVECTREVSPVASVEISVAGSKPVLLTTPNSSKAIGQLDPLARFPATILSELWEQQGLQGKMKFKISAQAPVGSSLGGSSSLCVALVYAFLQSTSQLEEPGWQWKVMAWCRDVEAKYMQKPTGTQDYLAALFGGLRCYHSTLGQTTEHSYSNSVFDELSKRAIILFSGEMHHSGRTNWEVFKAVMDDRSDVQQGMKDVCQIADEMDKELKGHCRWKEIGRLMSDDWHTRKKLFGVDTPRLDEVMRALSTQNILGAKVCGAAAGGSILVLCEPDRKTNFTRFCSDNRIEILPASCTLQGVSNIKA
ncbi:MAG: hypothetical protein HY537_06800 [Deltaproteobacteria bacterium]|nr:hypothetical protein [Deltaproteobacteria bacterium]